MPSVGEVGIFDLYILVEHGALERFLEQHAAQPSLSLNNKPIAKILIKKPRNTAIQLLLQLIHFLLIVTRHLTPNVILNAAALRISYAVFFSRLHLFIVLTPSFRRPLLLKTTATSPSLPSPTLHPQNLKQLLDIRHLQVVVRQVN